MRRALPILAVLACAAAPASGATAWERRPAMNWDCGDLVVTGQLHNLDYQDASGPDDMLGHGWYTAELRITRVMRGWPKAHRMRVRYLSHGQMLDDEDFLFVIHPSAEGDEIVAGNLLSQHPWLAKSCGGEDASP